MQAASTRRFRKGDLVRKIHDSSVRVGTILSFGTDETLVYVGNKEWANEFTPFAIVKFASKTEKIALKEIVSNSRVLIYESLKQGDFISYGTKNSKRALVVSVTNKERSKPYATNFRVIILDDGLKKSVSLRHNISIIRKA